ncbi:hypothetical protein ACS0TY_003767 [Phlomoides rotata]
MMHCLNSGNSGEMSVLERQRSRFKCQQQQFPLTYFNDKEELGCAFLGDQSLCELVNGALKPDPGLENDDFRSELSCAIPRRVSCPKKRKADDKTHNLKAIAEEKRMKGCAEEDKSTTTSASTAAKASEAPKTDYIHVRARRGEATDSHSLAERVRREKISERMKYLQDLVPGCNKITGKAGMLDEIINYVQSLQRQVEFLSMKLAAINPRLDFDVENYLLKEIIPTIGASSSDQFDLQFNSTLGLGLGQGGVSSSNLGMDMALRRTTSAPVSIPHNFLDSSTLLNQIQNMTWEDELQNLYNMEYQQARSTSFISQPFTGFQEQGHVKLEM